MTSVDKKKYKDWMKLQKESILELLDSEKYVVELHEEGRQDWGVFVYVAGIKLEWNWQSICIKLGYDSTPADVNKIHLFLENQGFEVGRTRKGAVIILFQYSCTVAQFGEIYEILQNHDIQLEKKLRMSNKEDSKGVNFSGTVFQNTKERGTTIGGMFGKMVCEASGMNRDFMIAEFQTKSDGEIDGVEIDKETEKPISIYECQSGIHYGNFLDENHLNKALNRYLYSKEIIPTVRKVVMLAGGYTNKTKKIIKERALELSLRPNPIEIVLLKTKRVENKITVEIEDYSRV